MNRATVAGPAPVAVSPVLPAFQNLTLLPLRGGDSGSSLVQEFWAELDALRPAGQPHAAESAHELITASCLFAALSDAQHSRAIRDAVRDFALEFNDSDVSDAARFDILAAGSRPTDITRWTIPGASDNDVNTVINRLPLLDHTNAEIKVRPQDSAELVPASSDSMKWCGRVLGAVEGV